MKDLIDRFLADGPYAVVGASNDRTKFGNRVLRAYVEHGRTAFPVHPSEAEVEGRPAFPSLAALPEAVRHVSIITPPPVTERVVEEAAEAGAEVLWMQPGAESAEAIERARELGMEVIAREPCVLVELPRRASL